MSGKSLKGGKSVPLDPDLLETEAQALALRMKGHIWSDIADQLGYSGPGSAYKAAMRALTRYPSSVADEYRALQNAELDQLTHEAWKALTAAQEAADHELALKAIDRVHKLLDRRAKLNGVDAPVKTDVTSDGAPIIMVNPDRLPLNASGVIEGDYTTTGQDEGNA